MKKCFATMPAIAWDATITAVYSGPATAVIDLTTAKQIKIFPNPVENGKLYLEYNLTTSSRVNIDIFDSKGSKTDVIFSGKQLPGRQLILWDVVANKIETGFYMVRFSIGREKFTKKIIVSGR
ncbi:MAG: T9SS type A sorting domain-containing protein [Bacteroidota bacterium]|nr:T9SS type A sorting domain-containing protein [Bacteroidota bacterium]